MAQVKTNAIRILEQKKINYNLYTYENNDGKIDGISVAQKISKDIKVVYKTLVVQGNSKSIYVCVVPVAEEVDLKKVANVVGEKKVEMIPVNDILKFTGYIRGGCSPVGMKKNYKTLINKSASELDEMVVSGGKIGVQIEVKAVDLVNVTEAELVDIIR